MQLLKDLGDPTATRLAFFRTFTYVLSFVGAAILLAGAAYFAAGSKAISSQPSREISGAAGLVEITD